MVSNKNDKITMKRDARERKEAFEKDNKCKMHTVVFDDSEVYNAGGEGKHDVTKRKIYYRRGYGSFRVGNMYQVTDMEELAKLLDLPPGKLPEGAKAWDT